ncbi:hypothetical protein G7Y89_g753 [Cudoniella acicularis]|uniref:Aquaporin n=1 Tax=Cudoniella acicularis TaxID=354080 RepID=A0A8H4RWM4_9HELO|nr:hypothetical protein G7Y89_g753 [Cudoniella acicularis]
MAGDGPSELPLHYGSKTMDGGLIKRPSSPIVPASPLRFYQPGNRLNFSPERTPIDAYHSIKSENPRNAGLRRRPSHQNPIRRHSGDFGRERPGFSSEARRPLRSRDNQFYLDEDAVFGRNIHSHLNFRERSRPPRGRDLERGEYSPNKKTRHSEDDSSVDGYNYEARKCFNRGTVYYKSLIKEEKKEALPLPWLAWMNSSVKNHFVATLGEFVGTTMFLFFAFAGTQLANIQSSASSASSSTSNTTSRGATGFNVSIFFRISGGLFNPAVTLAMVLVGAIPVVRAICLFFAQIVGAIAASGMVLGLFPTKFNVRTTLAGGASLVQGVFIEAILTAELVFTIFMLAKEKNKVTFIAPVGIGLALFIAEMVGVYYTSGSLNLARSTGPCIVTGIVDKEHWIYFFYKFIKMLEYGDGEPRPRRRR